MGTAFKVVLRNESGYIYENNLRCVWHTADYQEMVAPSPFLSSTSPSLKWNNNTYLTGFCDDDPT